MSVKRNLSLASLRRDQRRRVLRGFLNAPAENRVAAAMIEMLRIKVSNDRLAARFLSGGNQQKVVLGKWLALAPRVDSRRGSLARTTQSAGLPTSMRAARSSSTSATASMSLEPRK